MRKLLKHLKKEILIIVALAIFIAIIEIQFLIHLKDAYRYIGGFGISPLFTIILLALIYFMVILSNLSLTYFIRYIAFEKSLTLSAAEINTRTSNGALFTEPELQSILSVEKERLAREVIYPCLNIATKIMLPIIALYELKTVPVSVVTTYISPVLFVLVVYIVCALMFRRFAGQLELGIRETSKGNHAYVKLYRSTYWQFKNLGIERLLFEKNKNISKVEAKIDLVSQAPRAAIDVFITLFILLSLYFSNQNVIEVQSVLFASPLLVRAAANLQFTYKSFASLVSNLKAIKVLNAPFTQGNVDVSGKEIVDIDILIKQNKRVIGISYPSGFGKTNAILNLLHPKLNAKSGLLFKTKYNVCDIGFVSSDPYFVEEYTQNLSMQARIFSKHLDDKNLENFTVPENCSQGELFRANLMMCLALNPRLIIIDESLSYVDKNRRGIILEYLKAKLDAIVIVSHNEDILKLCDIVISKTNRKG